MEPPPTREAATLQVPAQSAGVTVVRSGLLLKLGGKSWARKLQWRQCRLLSSGSFEYSEVKKDGTLFVKGELKLKDAECRLEGSGGLMYDLLAKMVGNPAKIPKVPSSKTPPVWEGHGFFYIKPAMLRVKKPGKTYFFVCNMKDRDAWIDAVRSTIVSMENLRLSSAMASSPNASGIQLQQIPPLRSSPSSPSITGVTITAPTQFAPPGAESDAFVAQPASPVRVSNEMSPVVVDAYMQARAQFGPASSSSHTAFATLRSGRSVHEEDGDDATNMMVSTFSGATSITPSQQEAETDIQKAQLNSFFQSPTRPHLKLSSA
eukprot:TRINITY_DN6055_c0_g1_i1.p1 TRINITY_DN6055_c0_g1~~TRINITY_DN6055_c0_g1_i1.p1  ORF type:complete len:319 (-),score=39.44 TRINITY_DN6055_c0_g1_i1:79-1035(-)